MQDGHYQWNSCTSGDYESPSCVYYNADNCTHQQSGQGIGGYSGTMYCWGIPSGYVDDGCSFLNGKTLTFSGSYMEVWELDSNDFDEFVKTLYYPNLQRTIANCTVDDCPSQASAWTNVSSYYPTSGGQVINAQIRFVIDGCAVVESFCP